MLGGRWSCKEQIACSNTGNLMISMSGGHLNLISNMHSFGTSIESVGCGCSTIAGE